MRLLAPDLLSPKLCMTKQFRQEKRNNYCRIGANSGSAGCFLVREQLAGLQIKSDTGLPELQDSISQLLNLCKSSRTATITNACNKALYTLVLSSVL